MRTKTDSERYNSFKKRNHLTHENIFRIAYEYANTDNDKARTYFCEKYHISEHVFYKCLEFAIICHLVNEETRKAIKIKAVNNYKLHNDRERVRQAKNHYAKLTEKRQEFFNQISNEVIMDIGYQYAEGTSLTAISKTYEMCKHTIKKLLAKGVREVIFPSPLVDSIKQRIQSEGKDLISFRKLEEEREFNRDKQLKPFKEEIQVLKFQLESYEAYFYGDETVPSKEFLQKRLDEVSKKYKRGLEF